MVTGQLLIAVAAAAGPTFIAANVRPASTATAILRLRIVPLIGISFARYSCPRREYVDRGHPARRANARVLRPKPVFRVIRPTRARKEGQTGRLGRPGKAAAAGEVLFVSLP